MGALGPDQFHTHFPYHLFTINGGVLNTRTEGAGLFHTGVKVLDEYVVIPDRMPGKDQWQRKFH